VPNACLRGQSVHKKTCGYIVKIPTGNQRLFQLSLKKILRPGGHAALGKGVCITNISITLHRLV
jgi:hypothetical protein